MQQTYRTFCLVFLMLAIKAQWGTAAEQPTATVVQEEMVDANGWSLPHSDRT